MLNLQYVGSEEKYRVDFMYISKNIIQVIGDFPVKLSGFTLTRVDDYEVLIGDYSAFTTVYKQVINGAQFSSDGSVYVKATPKVGFYVAGKGSLEGKVIQEATDYSDLAIPVPVPDDNYEFTQWVPEVPKKGKIDEDTYFTAMFINTSLEPLQKLTIEERITVVEEDLTKINSVLGG